MTTWEYNRQLVSVARLRDQLIGNGFPSAKVAFQESSPPKTYVFVDEPGDPSSLVNAYVDFGVLSATSDQPPGPDGVPQCPGDGVATHTLTIKKLDPYTGQQASGSETVQIIPSFPVTVAPSQIQLVNGLGTASIGPTTLVGDFVARLIDVAGNLTEATIRLRFI